MLTEQMLPMSVLTIAVSGSARSSSRSAVRGSIGPAPVCVDIVDSVNTVDIADIADSVDIADIADTVDIADSVDSVDIYIKYLDTHPRAAQCVQFCLPGLPLRFGLGQSLL